MNISWAVWAGEAVCSDCGEIAGHVEAHLVKAQLEAELALFSFDLAPYPLPQPTTPSPTPTHL